MLSPILPDARILDVTAERIVIGYIMEYSNADGPYWIDHLHVDCFTDPRLRVIFEAMCLLQEADKRPDPVNLYTLMQQMPAQSGGIAPASIDPGELYQLCQEARTDQIEGPVELLRQFRTRRDLQELGMKIQWQARTLTMPVETIITTALGQLDAMDAISTRRFVSYRETAVKLRQRMKENQDDPERHHGPWTGIKVIDDDGGLAETGLVVIPGGTSQGKSSFCAGIVVESAKHKMKSAYFSLELTDVSLAARMTAMEGSGITSTDIMRRKLSDTRWDEALRDIEDFDEKYGDMIWFDASRTSQLDDICMATRQIVRQQGVRLVVVDYVQQLNYTMANTRLQQTTEALMGQAARCLKNLADKLGITIILASQINRSLSQQRPKLDVIRDSGQIAEAADMVIFCWRPEQYHGQYDLDLAVYDAHNTIALLMAKNREGALHEVVAEWNGPRTKISELSAEAEAEAQRLRQGEATKGKTGAKGGSKDGTLSLPY